MDGGSRQAERELEIDGDKIHCFSTPTRVRAEEHLEHARQQGRSDFYGWVRNGMSLFHALADVWPLYRGECQFPFSVETFPHAVACYLEGRRVARGVRARRQLLDRVLAGPISGQLGNADFVDAALCALAARAFGGQQGGPGQTYRQFGNPQEGFIVVPRGQG